MILYALDSCVLMSHDVDRLVCDEHRQVIIPTMVLFELQLKDDRIHIYKKLSRYTGLKQLTMDGRVVPVQAKESEMFVQDLSTKRMKSWGNDEAILDACRMGMQRHKGVKIVLVTDDVLMRLKAYSFSVTALSSVDYLANKTAN